MFLVKRAPKSPGFRHKKTIISTYLYTFKFKRLWTYIKEDGGRNNSGRIRMLSRGGSKSKHSYATIDKYRRWSNFIGVVLNISRDIHRTTYIALIKYSNGSYANILSPHGLFLGDFVRSIFRPQRFALGYKIGYAVIIKYLFPNDIFFNIELKPNKGGVYSKAAGTYCKLVVNDFTRDLALIILPTGLKIRISYYCLVTLGKASNPLNFKKVIGKAGTNRLFNRRPSVRGVAMNPVDHPHGGRTKTNSPEKTPWNKIAKNSH